MLARIYISILLLALLKGSFAQVGLVQENQAGISRRLQFEIDITKDPKLGFVPKYRLIDAYKIKDEKIQEAHLRRASQGNALMDPNQNIKTSSTSTTTSTSSTSVSIAAIPTPLTWTERGPYADAVGPSNGNTRAGNAVTSGRVRAIWEDLNDATGNTVWAGGIDGGLWKTTNFNATLPTWVPINDKFNNMAISSICQDPIEKNILYFGTGEKTINADAVRGAGVWMSTDGGNTWSVMAGTGNFWNISKVACDKDGNLYVGCNALNNTAGLQRLLKGSSTWENITPSGLDTRIPDFEISINNKLHVSCGYYSPITNFKTGYRFTSNPSLVTSSSWDTPITTFPTQYNVDITSTGDILFALASDASWQIPFVYKSTDGGVNWSTTSTAPPSNWASGQAWYSMAIAINPLNINEVLIGGLDCYRTKDGGNSWSKVSEWVGPVGQYVHADQHIMHWNKNNRIIVGNDGGVFESIDGGSTFKDKNTGLRIKQFYSVAMHPSANTDYFLGGTQDNGVHQINSGGLAPSVEVTGGDGGFVKIDQDQPQYQWGSYVFNQYRRSIDGGKTWTWVDYSKTSGRFINPIDYDDARNIMYCSSIAGNYLVWSNPQSGSTFTARTVPTGWVTGGIVSAIKVSPYTANTVFLAGGGNNIKPSLVRVSNANLSTRTSASIISSSMQFTSSNISSINLGKTDSEIVVTFSNYGITNVWVTYNGGSNWTPIDGNLPDMPVRWAMFHPDDSKKIIIATETGVWQTDQVIDNVSTAWYPESGFPNVRVDMLHYRKSDRMIAAATHGRGIYTTILPGGSTAPTCGSVTGLTATSITSSSATLNWSALSGASNYDVDYSISGSTTWTSLAIGTTNLSVNLTGLSASTTYAYRVRANCSGTPGSYTQSSFVTLANTSTCTAPTGLNTTNITASSATLNWTAVSTASNGYQVKYWPTSNSTAVTTVNATSNSLSISGLLASTGYSYQVASNCAGTLSAFSVISSFSTSSSSQTPCASVYDNSTNNTIGTGASTIPLNIPINGSISTSTDVDNYTLKVSTSGSTTFILSNLPSNYDLRLLNNSGTTIASKILTGNSSESFSYTLAANTTYYVQVKIGSKGVASSSCYTLQVNSTVAKVTLSNELVSGNTYKNNSSINELPNQSFKLFPNPSQDKLTIYMVSDNTSKSMQLFNAKGALVYSQKLSDMFTTLDVHKLTPGIYFVRIMGENGKVVHQEKILKH